MVWVEGLIRESSLPHHPEGAYPVAQNPLHDRELHRNDSIIGPEGKEQVNRWLDVQPRRYRSDPETINGRI